MSHYRLTSLRVAVGLALVATLATAASCSSSSQKDTATLGSSVGTTGAGASGVDAAATFIRPYVQVPDTIGISTPLSGRPPSGKKVVFIAVADPLVNVFTDNLRAATKALGWTLQVQTWATNPADANSLMQQAVAQKADYIAYEAVPVELLKSGLAAAKAADIPVFESYDVTDPAGPANWLFSNPGGVKNFRLRGQLTADYITVHAKGKADVLMVNVPSFPVQKAFAESVKSQLTTDCTGCPYAELNFTYADLLGGKVTSAVVNYLRTHKSVNNIVFGFNALTIGFATAAQSAGIKVGGTGIQVSVQNPSPTNLKDIAAGTVLAAAATGLGSDMYLLVDAMARKSLNMDLTVNWTAQSSQLLQTKDNTSSDGSYYLGPKDYASQFTKLWNVI